MRISDWSSDVCSSDLKGRDLPVVIRAKAGMTPLHVRGGRVTQRITRAAKQWPGTRYHAGMFAKPDLHVAPVTPERIDARSEERRVGKECVRKCRSRGSPVH